MGQERYQRQPASQTSVSTFPLQNPRFEHAWPNLLVCSDDADEVFALGGTNTYSQVRNSNWRGTELGQAGSEWFKINCDTRPVCLGTQASNLAAGSKGDPHCKFLHAQYFVASAGFQRLTSQLTSFYIYSQNVAR
jgi:hypothetical protein